MSFIAIPLKTTYEVDFVKTLKSYVNNLPKLNKKQRTDAIEGLAELNRLRKNTCIQPLEKSPNGMEYLMRYFDQLCAIENKLPISPAKNPIPFQWKDAFDKWTRVFNKPLLVINDSEYERAAVLYNIGAFMTQIAVAQKGVTDDELKTMSKLFQQAAGVFTKLKDHVMSLKVQYANMTVDLTVECLSAIIALMLAQAQEMVYLKAVKDNMKSAALIKISLQVADFYRDTQTLMAVSALKNVFDRDWINTIASKASGYAALGQYHYCEPLDIGQIGEKISRLGEAYRLISNVTGFTNEKEAIKKAFQLSSKENDMIYHERPPEFKNLPELSDRVVLAKIIPTTFPMSQNFKDIFESSLTPEPGTSNSCSIM